MKTVEERGELKYTNIIISVTKSDQQI